jgi:hypothetical protein
MVSASRENSVLWHEDGLGVRYDARASQGGARNVAVLVSLGSGSGAGPARETRRMRLEWEKGIFVFVLVPRAPTEGASFDDGLMRTDQLAATEKERREMGRKDG